MEKTQEIVNEVVAALNKAMEKHPKKFSSTHEGYAILLEEVDEVWDAIKKDDHEHARKEMIHVAAMSLRFLHDLYMTPQEILELQKHMNQVGISPTFEERAEWDKVFARNL